MLLVVILLILVVVFFSSRYGFRAASKPVRVLSYVGVFLSIALMVYLLTVYITEKLAADLPIL